MIVTYQKDNVRVAIHLPEDVCELDPKNFLKKIKAVFNKGLIGREEIIPQGPEDALLLMSAYIEAIESKTKVPPIIEKYILNCFRILLNADKIDRDLPAKAFGLRRLRRGKPTKNLKRDRDITEKIIDLMEEGESLMSASLSMSEQYGIHESNIQNIYCKFQKEVRREREPDPDIPF